MIINNPKDDLNQLYPIPRWSSKRVYYLKQTLHPLKDKGLPLPSLSAITVMLHIP